MNFEVDPVHEDIRQSIRALCRTFPDEYWMEHDESKEFPWEFYNAVVAGGWLGLTIPKEYGGGGLGVTEAAIVEQEVAASGAGMGGCTAIHIGIFGFESVTKYGSEELKKRWLPRAASGELHVSFAVTEPDAGTDTTNIKTFARKVDGGYLISGKKVWISKAQEAERMFLLARTTPLADVQKKTYGMTLFFAPVDRDRVSIRRIPKLGRNAVDTNELFIEDLFVSDDDVIGEVGHGFKAILAGLNAERVIAGNAAVGIGRAALRRGVEYAKQRVVFGRPIGQNQGIGFQLAEAQIRLDAADTLLQKAAWLIDHGLPHAKEANEAKFLAAEAGFHAADVAVQVHGGYGYAKEYHVERYFREARLMRIAPISQEMVLNYIAEHVLELPRELLMRPYRSILFVPGHKPSWALKALAAGPDAIILDLEDSVPAADKAAARGAVAGTIAKLRAESATLGVGVRVNGLMTKMTGTDLEQVIVPGLDLIFAPKIEQPSDVVRYDALIDHFELRNGVSGLEYIIPVETVPAILNAADIAVSSPRIGAMIGPTAEHADIAREVGFTWTPEGTETLYLRSRILLACRRARIHPLTGLWERLDDLDGLAQFAARARGLGFRGMIVIYPSHVATVNAAFTPTSDEIEFHRGLVDAYEAAARQGSGAVRYRGLHVDYAHYDKAVQWLATAEMFGGGR